MSVKSERVDDQHPVSIKPSTMVTTVPAYGNTSPSRLPSYRSSYMERFHPYSYAGRKGLFGRKFSYVDDLDQWLPEPNYLNHDPRVLPIRIEDVQNVFLYDDYRRELGARRSFEEELADASTGPYDAMLDQGSKFVSLVIDLAVAMRQKFREFQIFK